MRSPSRPAVIFLALCLRGETADWMGFHSPQECLALWWDSIIESRPEGSSIQGVSLSHVFLKRCS